MTCHPCCVEVKADCRVGLGETEEGIREVVGVQRAGVVFDQIGNVHEHLVVD
jgi:hypothetical protein